MNKSLKELSKLPYFRISHFKSFLPYLKKPSLYQKISRSLKKGNIIKLKKGFYTTKEYGELHSSDLNYFYYLANILCYPSYVSGAYVLQNYNILTDITYPITSITTKTSRKYYNKLGDFIYYSISPKLYTGYKRLLYEDEPIYVASVAKALFDYLYLKYFITKLGPEKIISRERLNLESFSKKDIKEFEKYCKLSNKKILIKLCAKMF